MVIHYGHDSCIYPEIRKNKQRNYLNSLKFKRPLQPLKKCQQKIRQNRITHWLLSLPLESPMCSFTLTDILNSLKFAGNVKKREFTFISSYFRRGGAAFGWVSQQYNFWMEKCKHCFRWEDIKIYGMLGLRSNNIKSCLWQPRNDSYKAQREEPF